MMDGIRTGMAEVERHVRGFRAHLVDLHEEQTLEATIRHEYLNPFWKALGWDVANDAHRSAAEKDVVVEAPVWTIEAEGRRNRRPDYLFRIDGFPRFVVEAKKPAVNLVTDDEAIFQAKTYAWSAQIPFAVLTNFEQFRLFDATLKPYQGEPERGLVGDFDIRFEDYLTQWDVIWDMFSRQAVAGGSLEALLGRLKKVRAGRRVRGVDRMLFELRGTEPVDRVFLAHLEDYRLRFARALYQDNRVQFPDAEARHGAAKLSEATQRLIDRIVFMRVCEDREIISWGRLRDAIDEANEHRQDLYAVLCGHFREFDSHFNGYLFKAHFSEQLAVPAELLAEFIRSLYPSHAPYRFDAIGDDLLGIIYERFLGSEITVRRGEVEAEEKPEVRHAGGVYYTPRFVVDTIIRRVVVPQIEGKSPLQVLGVKILDPACGSGSFLIAAYQYLVDHCLRYIAEHPKASEIPASEKARKKTRKIAFRDPEGQWHLSPEFKADLVTSCIHGVDIDAQAVEVTIMSLYLKMLEGKLPSGWQKVWGDWRRLPPLDNNICCGNSLLSQTDFDDYWEVKNGSLFAGDADEVRFRINAFDWNSQTRGFGRLLDEHEGFDCIIGNPPYIRVQELNKWAPDECEFYKWRYKSAEKGNFDIYVAFIEHGLQLLAPDGLLGVICPHKYWQAAYGAGLRELIADGRHLRSIVDFADQQVFRGATTYTAIQIFSKGPSPKRVPVARFVELIDGDAQCTAIDAGARTEGVTQFHASAPPSLEPWHFESASLAEHKEAVNYAATMSLGEMTARMFQGIRTSLNEVFVVRCLDRRKARYRSEYLSSTVELEHDLLRPFLSGEDIRRYYLIDSNQYVLIPYRRVRRSPIALVDTKEMQSRFPRTWKYLTSCETALRGRERGRMDHDQWYAFVYPKNLDVFGVPRIVVRDIVQRASFALDEEGRYAFVSGYGITLKETYKGFLAYLLGLLNSKLLDGYLKSVSTTLRGGWFRPFPQFLKQLPIKLPQSAAEKKLAGQISERVHRIIEIKERLQATGLGDRERERGEREVEAHENRINELVCRLYGVDEIPEE